MRFIIRGLNNEVELIYPAVHLCGLVHDLIYFIGYQSILNTTKDKK